MIDILSALWALASLVASTATVVIAAGLLFGVLEIRRGKAWVK